MIIVTAIPSPLSPRHAIRLLSVLADIYAEEMVKRPLPPLSESGVRYREEENSGSGFEEWADPWAVHKRGFGDCDDLVLWRLAELRRQGEDARIRLREKDGRMHVQIIRRSGRQEDPSLEAIERERRR